MRDLSALFKGQLTPEVLEEAVRLGYIDVDGDRVIHVSRRLLDTATVLVREGIPLPAILATGRELQSGLDKMASLFVELVITHVLDRSSGAPPPHEVARLAETIERLRPIARTVLDAEFGRAMDRRARVTYDEFIRLLAARDRRAGPAAHPTHQENRTHRGHLRHRVHQAGKPLRNSHGCPARISSEPGQRT